MAFRPNVLRLDREGFASAADLKPAVTVLTEADVVRSIDGDAGYAKHEKRSVHDHAKLVEHSAVGSGHPVLVLP